MKKKSSILMAASEVVPFAGTGGLGEVIGSLPKKIMEQAEDLDVRVVMPLYGQIDDKHRKKMKFLGSTYIQVAWRNLYAGVFQLRHNGVIHYFIDNEYYFKRPGSIYGFFDECERFAFFSKAVIDCLPLMEFEPDIIHAHDWQTAMVPVYQSTVEGYPPRKTVFTIHNVEYQGRYGMEVLGDVLGIDKSKKHLLEYNRDINLMKGAIETANIVSTVSPSYAQELKDPFFAHGLAPIIRRNDQKLRGILNGIDTTVYDPKTDDLTFAKYSVTAPARKKRNKECLQKMLNLPVEKDIPILAVISRLVPHKGMDLVMKSLERLLGEEDFQLVILGTGEARYENFFSMMASYYPDRIAALIKFDRELSHKIYAGSDILLMPSKSEPCGLSQMIACRYGVVPIVRETGGLKDSIKDCSLGKGDGFTFAHYNENDFYEAVKRAISLYGNKENWMKLMKHNMRLKFGWDVSAKKYAKMYGELLNN
ncbi:MAG: glycogen synthase [Anaerovoracaceae bacterium]|jgi:starch synthase